MNDHSDELPRHSDELPRHSDELPRHSDELPRHSDELNDPSDELMQQLAALDPVRSDSPPAAGSPRFNASKERAMSPNSMSTDTSHSSNPGSAGPVDSITGRPKRRSRTPLVASVAAVFIAFLSLTLFLPGLTTASAAEKVRSAATNNADITSLRIDIETDSFSLVPDGRATIEVSDGDAHLIDESFEVYFVDGGAWMVVDGNVISMGGETDEIVSYSEASRVVIDAALQSDQVSDQGTELIGDVEATRYLVEIDDKASAALAAVPTEHLIWFTEETEEEVSFDEDEQVIAESRSGFLDLANTLTIWVADDLIHRIAVDSPDVQFTHTYYDFNAPIEITLPE